MAPSNRRARRTTQGAAPRKPGWFDRISKALKRGEPWFPWAVAGVMLAVMSYLAFRYHTVGGIGVETDFYAELYPPAKKLLTGQFSPLNYSAKGPVYSILLAGIYLFIRDFFTAGLLLNLASAALFLIVFYFLTKMVFNTLTAAITLFAAATNFQFLSHIYQVGSDIPFMLLCGLSMFFLFRDRGIRDLSLSAVFGLLAFLTRYNGAFLMMGAFVYYAFTGGDLRERFKRIGLWLAVFTVAGLLWFIPNWIVTGSPVKNANYVNVMMDFYGGADYEKWTDALPKQFTGMTDVFLYDPAYFVRHYAKNVTLHFFRDMRELVGLGVGMFAILGMLALTVIRPVKRNLLYLAFGLFYFLILALVFYNPRFSLFLLAVYLPFTVWPFTLRVRPAYFRWVSRFMLAVCVFMICFSVPASVVQVNREIRNPPEFLRDLGLALGSVEPDKTQKIIARKPHTAYYAGLQPLMFPNEPQTIAELVAYCRSHGIRYILYGVIEARMRPQLGELARMDVKHPGLTMVYHSDYGVIYRVDAYSAE